MPIRYPQWDKYKGKTPSYSSSTGGSRNYDYELTPGEYGISPITVDLPRARGVDPSSIPRTGYDTNDYGDNSDFRTYAGAGLGLLGLIGGGSNLKARSYDVYDPAHTALSRYRELVDPNSNSNLRLKALFGKYFAEGSATVNTLLGVSRANGIDSTALAYQKRREIENQNKEQTLNAFQRQMLNQEQSAAGYLGMHYNMLQEQARENFESSQRASSEQTSFWDQLIGLGGGLLSKAIV